MTKGTEDGAIRVLIVDDHAVLRSGLHLLLDAQAGIEVVGEAGDVKEAVFEAREKKPDIVLMDVVMPGQTGIEGVPLVLKEAPKAKVKSAQPPKTAKKPSKGGKPSGRSNGRNRRAG